MSQRAIIARKCREAGFTLIEVLLATLLMSVILAALTAVTAQWLPNWNRGMVRVQRAERLAIGLERVLADLSAARIIPISADTKRPLFEGSELSVTFVRTAVGPNTRPGLEIIRLTEKADVQGLALVRERTPFMPMPLDTQIRFADQVVLNVRSDNPPALLAYRRLGYAEHVRFEERLAHRLGSPWPDFTAPIRRFFNRREN